jgi:hypothetical protein
VTSKKSNIVCNIKQERMMVMLRYLYWVFATITNYKECLPAIGRQLPDYIMYLVAIWHFSTSLMVMVEKALISVNDLHYENPWKSNINVWIVFLNKKFMQKRVNVLDSQSFNFFFLAMGQSKWPIVPKKQIQSFEMHHN